MASSTVSLATIVAEGTMRAFADLAIRRRVTVDMDAAVVAIRREAHVALDKLIAEAEELIEVHPALQRSSLNAECVAAGARALDSLAC